MVAWPWWMGFGSGPGLRVKPSARIRSRYWAVGSWNWNDGTDLPRSWRPIQKESHDPASASESPSPSAARRRRASGTTPSHRRWAVWATSRRCAQSGRVHVGSAPSRPRSVLAQKSRQLGMGDASMPDDTGAGVRGGHFVSGTPSRLGRVSVSCRTAVHPQTLGRLEDNSTGCDFQAVRQYTFAFASISADLDEPHEPHEPRRVREGMQASARSGRGSATLPYYQESHDQMYRPLRRHHRVGDRALRRTACQPAPSPLHPPRGAVRPGRVAVGGRTALWTVGPLCPRPRLPAGGAERRGTLSAVHARAGVRVVDGLQA